MTKQISNHAAAAKMIRKELKKNGIKATVRAKSYSGGSSITVSLTNALPATVDKIEAYAGQFEYGHFDGMTDMYEYSNTRDDIPQVKFVFVNNEWTDDKKADAWDYCKAHHAGMSETENPETFEDHDTVRQLMAGRWGQWLQQQKPRVRAA